jgi:hypothetical protein
MLEEVEFQNPWVAHETANNGRTADKNDEKLWNDKAMFLLGTFVCSQSGNHPYRRFSQISQHIKYEIKFF